MAETSKESTSDSPQSTEQDRPKLPPVDFSAFIAELGTTVFAYLGELQNPETNEVFVDLEMAKRTIDTIDLLKEKTKGNLTAPERVLLDNTLYNLPDDLYTDSKQSSASPEVGNLRIDKRNAIGRNGDGKRIE